MEEKNETLENLDVSELYLKANAERLVYIKELSRQIKSVTTKDKIKFWFATKYCGHIKEIYFKIIDAIPEQSISDCEKAANEIVEAIFQNIFNSNSGFELTEKIQIPVLHPEDYKAAAIVDDVKFKTTMQVNITDNVKESICKLGKEFDKLKVNNIVVLQPLQDEYRQQVLEGKNTFSKEVYEEYTVKIEIEERNMFIKAFDIVSSYFIDKIENNLIDKVAKEFARSYPITICIDKFDEIKICVNHLRFLTSDNEETYIRKVVIDKEVIIPDVKKICIDFIVKTDLF